MEFTEALTLVSQSQQIPDELYDRVHSFFSDREMATLTLAIGMINTWNRFALAFQSDLSSIDYLLKKTAEMDEAFAESRLAACS
ncbi:carboxymuconolactone decarboxylase family protein [Rhodopirellula sp. MGV]|uniref:carboxymuconolactone decarboxylase family protein n=1 Tax=Rhodopirellula sp. MGV TaxID=2023130 RepID=UPI000B975354|nr:hypothetical protein [Rhodopirellula sp. MGV]OYP36553.1 hypothetical protein CGZ80_07930 [Rhodopirellula sp. MGV]